MDISSITGTIVSLSPVYKYILLFLLVALEGPIVSMVAGFLIASDLVNPYLTYIIIIIADVTSDQIYYAIGWWGGERVTKKFVSLTKLSSERLARLVKIFHAHPGKTLVTGKLTHVAGIPIIIAAGVAKIRLSTFIFYDALATLPKTLIFILIGYYLSRASSTLISHYLAYGSALVSGIMILALVIYIFLGSRLEKKLID